MGPVLTNSRTGPSFLPSLKVPNPSIILVPLNQLRPTQGAVGMRAVARKRAKVEKRVRAGNQVERYLEQRPIPIVLGPGNQLFMIDHHHLGMALWQAEIETAVTIVIEDFSVLPAAVFWRRMEAGGWLYPFNEDGQRIPPSKLPARIKGLRPDSFRDLASSVRDAGGYHKSSTAYAEFEWADFFRARIAHRLVDRDYDAAVRKARRLSRTREARDLPGFIAN